MVQYNLVSNWSEASSWIAGGIPFDIPGNGGAECVSFSTPTQRLVETMFWSTVALMVAWIGWRAKSPPTVQVDYSRVPSRTGRRVILAIFGLVFGIEIGYKLAGNQVIWLLNPCHVMTALQLYLLAAPSTAVTTAMFRLHIYFINAAVLALLFPVTNSFFFPLETEIYWIQHAMILVVPFYLLRLGGQYNLEPLSNWGWAMMAWSVEALYHWWVLQPTGILFNTNLNCMVCPAVSDPFHGPHYRTIAMIHQTLLIPLLGKSYALFADFMITKFPLTKIKHKLGDQIKSD